MMSLFYLGLSFSFDHKSYGYLGNYNTKSRSLARFQRRFRVSFRDDIHTILPQEIAAACCVLCHENIGILFNMYLIRTLN